MNANRMPDMEQHIPMSTRHGMKRKTKQYSAALYLRLSRDDDKDSDSVSIGYQREMLTAYADEHGYKVYAEYIDDGERENTTKTL